MYLCICYCSPGLCTTTSPCRFFHMCVFCLLVLMCACVFFVHVGMYVFMYAMYNLLCNSVLVEVAMCLCTCAFAIVFLVCAQ